MTADASERLQAGLAAPRVLLLDWHATLADTREAMYHAMDEMLPRLGKLGLKKRLVRPQDSKTLDDAKLVAYVRTHGVLHPKVKTARKISRTDILEVLFGDDEEAKHLAHEAFNECYRRHYGEVHPFEPGTSAVLQQLRALGIRLGVLTNRSREFFLHEVQAVEPGGWAQYFDAAVCGDDVRRRKPAPDPVLLALEKLGVEPGPDCWYVGDSTTDTAAAKLAGITSVFYNGAGWDQAWLDSIFPGTARHPHRPDAVVQNFQELLRLVERRLADSRYSPE